MSTSCELSISAADFFRDTPWLQVPPDRLGEILIEPLYPRGGLLGGSSSGGSGGGGVSKLAALAAARKRKDEEKKASSTDKSSQQRPTSHSSSSIALLDRLGTRRKDQALSTHKNHPTANAVDVEKAPGSILRTPARQSPKPSPNARDSFSQDPVGQQPEQSTSDSAGMSETPDVPIKASPSVFARTMLGEHPDQYLRGPTLKQNHDFKLPYVAGLSFTESFAFTEPSPDDVVTNAQNSKGPSSSPL